MVVTPATVVTTLTGATVLPFWWKLALFPATFILGAIVAVQGYRNKADRIYEVAVIILSFN